jgi:hypothetical protein
MVGGGDVHLLHITFTPPISHHPNWLLFDLVVVVMI